jgi:capsular polysaccharide biosynthesis protein
MEISLKDLLKLFFKNLRLILICAIIGLACTFSIFNFLVKPNYVSSVKLYVYVKDPAPNTQYSNLNDLNYAQKVVNTYIEMLRTDSFYKSVKNNCKVSYPIEKLDKMIQFTILNGTEVFQVSVSSHDPEEAKKIADTITELAPKTIRSIKESALLKVVDSASLPAKPSSPNVYLDSILGLLLGAAASMIYIILKEMLDVRIKQEDDLTARYNIPILGTIPSFEIHSPQPGIPEKGAR